MQDQPRYNERQWLGECRPEERDIIEGRSSEFARVKCPVWLESRGIVKYKTALMWCSIYEPTVYRDDEFFIPLSPGQEPLFKQWVRAAEIFKSGPCATTYNQTSTEPQQIASGLHGYDVMASTDDGSTVAACLAAAAHYEYKSSPHDRIISEIIYPKDEAGNPIYNPAGKYVLKLFFNGAWREVTVDDRFPMGEGGAPLFTYEPSGALWPSILEKAYAKVRCGYDNIADVKPSQVMFALTSWLPERICLRSTTREALWEHLKGGPLLRDRVAVLSTAAVKEDVGLRSFCCYAILEAVECGTQRLLLLRNTSTETKWSGAYSWDDPISWTEETKKATGYESGIQRRDRLFWIPLDSVFEYFQYIDINWRPNLLTRRRNVWDVFPVKEMCDDRYNLLQSPQYSLEFNLTPADTLPEVVLCAIVTKLHTKDESLVAGDLPESALGEDLIGLSVFEDEKCSACSKVIYSDYPLNECEMTTDDVRAYRFVIPRDKLLASRYINVALKHFIKRGDLYYRYNPPLADSIAFVSSCSFEDTRVAEPYIHRREISLEVTESNSGGEPRGQLFHKNPQYVIKAESQTAKMASVRIRYEGPTSSFVTAILTQQSSNDRILQLDPELAEMVAYRPQFVCVETQIPVGQFYTVVFANWLASMMGRYRAVVESTVPIMVTEIKSEGHGLKSTSIFVCDVRGHPE